MTTILIVDDEEMIRVNLECFLEDEDYTVLCAQSGEEALEIMLRTTVDVGIIDMRLPGIDGNTVILEAHKLNPKMRFIVHTGSSEYSLPTELQVIGIGAGQILMKPLADMSLMLKAIESCIAIA